MTIIDKLQQDQVISPPKWLSNNLAYMTITGSEAYGVSVDISDKDVYGFCFPPKDDVFPHLRGEIPGFGQHKHQFAQWQEHHCEVPGAETVYDFTIFSIVKYFQLCMENNPNMIDTLFTPRRCVIHSTQVSEYVRDHRKEFLHKGCWHKFKGYAYAQMSKIRTKANASNPARDESIKKFGYDVKFATHLVRLLAEVEQIMVEHDLDLERNREQLKSIRRGEWTLHQVEMYFQDKEKQLEQVYLDCKLPYGPDEQHIKTMLLHCLEIHYGNLDNAIKLDVDVQTILNDIRQIIDKYSLK